MIISNSYLTPPQASPQVVVIGNFDGLHRGHQALLERAHEHASKRGLPRCVLTFDPHPSRLFGRDEPKAIYLLQDKLSLIASLGVEATLCQRFDHEFAALSPRAFVEEVLIKALQAQVIVVGYDFAFGHKRSGRVDDLKELCAPFGVELDVISQQRDEGAQQTYSSTWVRALIREGQLKLAEEALTRPYHLRAQVAKGYQRGRALGFPTANLALESELCPPPGVYAGWLDWGEGPWPSVLSIGENPSFSEPHLLAHQQPWSVEVHVIDPHRGPSELDLYGRPVLLWCVAPLREMRRFTELEALKAQISLDRDQALALLNELPRPTWPQPAV